VCEEHLTESDPDDPQECSGSIDVKHTLESESTESDPEKNATPKKKKQTRNELKYEKHNKQKYSSSWDLNPKFQKWIKPPTKTSCIVKNVIGKVHKESLVNILKCTKFSVLTNESTDISCVKHACIVVRYFNSKLGQICGHFYNLSPVFEPKDYEKVKEGATGKNLFESLIKSFQHNYIPLENIIGFASDGCNSMMGSKNSVASRMKEHFIGIVIMKCICHSLHLCASEACKHLPKRCEDLARNVYSYFAMSSKRTSEFIQFQEFCDVKIHKLLHPSQTRWLSLNLVVSRLLEQWQPLLLFFKDKVLVERVSSVEHILNCLNDPLIKLYFMLLDYLLPKFTSLNTYFQSSKVVITDLHDIMTSTYKEFLLLYMNSSSLMVLNFIILTRKLFKPKTALLLSTRKEYPSLFPILALLPRITKNNDDFIQKVDDEWRLLPNLNIPEDIKTIEDPDLF
ncbi:Uncharacterized protein FWK35_00015913, partial [Aphis craccivora]